jgi:antitoxin FitA
MGQVLVRNLDNRVIESLRTKAELKGRSLEQELRDVVTKAAPLTPEEKTTLFRKLRAMTPPRCRFASCHPDEVVRAAAKP